MEPKKAPTSQPLSALEARAKAIELLSDGFSHDARNPLNAVVIHLEVLSDKLRREQGSVPASIEKNIRSIREQVNRLDELVRRFVELVAPRRQGDADYDLSALVQSVVDQCTHHARLNRCDLRAEVAPHLRLAGSASELGVALALLLVGQIEGGQKRLVVRLEQAGGQLALGVEGAQVEGADPSFLELVRLAQANGGSAASESNRVVFSVPAPRAEPALRVISAASEDAAQGGQS